MGDIYFNAIFQRIVFPKAKRIACKIETPSDKLISSFFQFVIRKKHPIKIRVAITHFFLFIDSLRNMNAKRIVNNKEVLVKKA